MDDQVRQEIHYPEVEEKDQRDRQGKESGQSKSTGESRQEKIHLYCEGNSRCEQ